MSSSAKSNALGVPWYVALERLIRETAPTIGVVLVNYWANGEVGLMAVKASHSPHRAVLKLDLPIGF